MSKKRELLKKIWEDLDGDRDNYNMLCEAIEELLAKPEPQITQREEYQRGYAQAERDLKREPLSVDKILTLSKCHTDRLNFARAIENEHGI